LKSWRYHCDIENSAYCEQPQESKIKTGSLRFYKGLAAVKAAIRIRGGDADASPSRWSKLITNFFLAETQQNTLQNPENWISKLPVSYVLTPEERLWNKDSYVIISKNNGWSLVKWKTMDCRHALWVPNSRLH
jgi:hypothetical protein